MIADGIGRPINPAFSTMLMVSFAIYPITTASLTKFVFIIKSSLQAIRTIKSVMPFLHNPFHPALDSNLYASFSDGKHCVSFDHVVEVMKQTGKDLPSLYKETSTGGLAKGYKRKK